VAVAVGQESARPICGTVPAPELLVELLPEELELEEVAPEEPLLDELLLDELAPEELLLEDVAPEELLLDETPLELLELLEEDPPLLVEDPPVLDPVPSGLLGALASADEESLLELSLQATSAASSAHSAIRVKIPCPIINCPRLHGRYNAEDSCHIHPAERVLPEVIAHLRKAVLAARLLYRPALISLP
jgi:hypothetical protein